MMRPKAVILAEQIYGASIVALVAGAMLTWTATVAQTGIVLAGGLLAFIVGLSVLLLILTTRRASRVALWLLVAITALTAVGVGLQVSQGVLAVGLVGVLTIVQLVLTIVPVVLLFRPQSRAWFDAVRDGEIEE